MMTPRAPEPALSGLRRTAKRVFFASGHYHRRLAQFGFPGVAVLCYHSVRGDHDTVPFQQLHVTREMFERHCRFLAEACSPISLADLRAARAGVRALPPRPVIVTFDDGYLGVLEHALPALERHRVPATVFVTAGSIVDREHFWFDVLSRREGEDAVVRAKQAAFAEWRQLFESLRTRAPVGERHRPMTPEELTRLAASPMIEIGGHSMIHPTLARAPLAEQRREIAGCRTVLHELLQQPIASFAYPYGSRMQDFAPETVIAVGEAGYDLAFTTGSSFAAVRGDPLQIPRFVMLDSIGESELAHRLLYSWHANGVVI